MRKLILFSICAFLSVWANAASYYSIADGLWSDGTKWSTTSGGAAVGGTLTADGNSFYVQNGKTMDFSGYNPAGAIGSANLYIQNGILNSTTAITSNIIRVYLSSTGQINSTADFYPYYLVLVGDANINITGADLKVSSLYSTGGARNLNFTAKNVYVNTYNYNGGSVLYQNNTFNTTINITSATGKVEIDNYYDNAASTLTINNGDFDIDDASADINGVINVPDGDIILPNSYTYNIFGELTADLTYNHSFDSNTRTFSVENGGKLTLTGSGSNTLEVTDNMATKGILVKQGATVSLTGINYDYKGWGAIADIAGTFVITDGNINQYSGTLTITQTGKLILRDLDQPTTAAAIDKGIYNMWWGGKTLNNYGMFMAEKYETHSSGSNVFNNYEVMFIKSFVTDNNANSLNIIDATIDNAEYLEPDNTPPPTYYSGSYLYYCTEEDDLNNIFKGASASIFKPIGADGVAGSTDIFTTVTDCYNMFYDQVSSALPISLMSFTARQQTEGVELQWSTASETNNDYFTVYRGLNATDFSALGTVAGAGTSAIENSYNFIDNNPKTGANYYRLSQTDYDGKTETFPILSVYVTKETSVTIYPTVVKKGAAISIRLENSQQYSVELLNSQGVLIQTMQSSDNLEFLQLQNSIMPGNYYLKLHIGNSIIIEKIIVTE